MREFIIFNRHLFQKLLFVRGTLLALLLVLLAFALITAKIDGISLSSSLYLVFITALTVGYGDITPGSGFTQIISVLAGLVGVIFVGLVVAVSTRALELAVEEQRRGYDDERRSDKGP